MTEAMIAAPEFSSPADELEALKAEREVLADKMESAHAVLRDLHSEYEHAREEDDLDALARLEPRIAAATTLAKQADSKLEPVARRIREIQQQATDAKDAAERLARLEQLGEEVCETAAAYQRSLRDLAQTVTGAIGEVADAHQARVAAIAGYQAQRAHFPRHQRMAYDVDIEGAENAVNQHHVSDRRVLQKLIGDDLGDMLWALMLSRTQLLEYEQRRRAGQIRSPLNF